MPKDSTVRTKFNRPKWIEPYASFNVTLKRTQMEELAEFLASGDQYCDVTMHFTGGREIRLDFRSE